MKTRAILQTSPFKTGWGDNYRAVATVKGQQATIAIGEAHKDLIKGDTITVERHGSEWRAV